MVAKSIKNAQNKMVEKSESKLQKFFFPDYGVTIEAKNMEEALKKVKKGIK